MLNIGFMQGRLSPMVGGRIQAFPWQHWRQEFLIAAEASFRLMEWTLDDDRFEENPFLTAQGQVEIQELSSRGAVGVPSVTGDCFMQAPFWKAKRDERERLEEKFLAVATACHVLGTTIIVIPLVDNGRLENSAHEEALVGFLCDQIDRLKASGLRIAFESDFAPTELARLIDRFDPAVFGVNYDIGNSAALGYDPSAEFASYGNRIVNVHVKDRTLKGGTVPLGTGNADIPRVLSLLADLQYRGNLILQTARAKPGDDLAVLESYRDMIATYLSNHAE